MNASPSTGPKPCARLEGVDAYRPTRLETPVDLCLDGNEGAAPDPSLFRVLAGIGPEVVRRYPDPWTFEQRLASRLGVAADRVLVTAGGDEAIDRVCRAFLEKGREMVLPVPTFEMFPRYVRLSEAGLTEVPWPEGPFPTERVLSKLTPRTSVVVVVSPNNPTGMVAGAEDLRRLSAAAPYALLLVDLAYAEFADEDLTEASLALPNAVVVRSLSKAWGVAGLRVGYAVGPAPIIGAMRSAGGPYAVARPSLALAAARLEGDGAQVEAFVARVRQERDALRTALDELGVFAWPSQANFVLARTPRADWLSDALAGLGIAVRAFPGRRGLEHCLRISCPGERASFERLIRALGVALDPQALLFDLDGVLADVSRSYREAIRLTAASFGVDLRPEAIAAAKADAQSNNDWQLTRRLLERRGVHADLAEVTERFEAFYQGADGKTGLHEAERLIPSLELLERLRARRPLAVVTGRPRSDAERFCRRFGLDRSISAMVCMEDALAKPDPQPVRLAVERLGVERAWMVGDTPDDLRAARRAGVLPLGVVAPGESASPARTVLLRAGAGRVLQDLTELEEVLP